MKSQTGVGTDKDGSERRHSGQGSRPRSKAVALFTGKAINKVDRKGRVSVPAGFRNELAKQSLHGVAVYPSLNGSKSLTGCGEDVLRQWSDSYRGDDPFDTDTTDKRMKLFSAVERLPFDADGRVLLPDDLLAHAGITTHAHFVAMGHEFQIWDPATFKAVRDAEKKEADETPAGQEAAPSPGEEQ